MIDRFGYSGDDAGYYITIPFTVIAFLGPILGLWLDQIGDRCTMTNITSVLLVVT